MLLNLSLCFQRAQMSWLHQEVKKRNKMKTEKNGEDNKGKEVENNKRNKEIRVESSDNISGKQKKSKSKKTEENSENSGSSIDSESDNPIGEALPTSVSKSNTDSNKSTIAENCISKDSKKLKPVQYEEVDENESDSESELEDEEKRQKKAPTKNKLINRKNDLREKKDSVSGNNKSSDENESENSSDDESDKSVENEGEESREESDFLEDSEINEKRAKKLLKKEKKKQKAIIPRSREVEVCKFSDLLKKTETR